MKKAIIRTIVFLAGIVSALFILRGQGLAIAESDTPQPVTYSGPTEINASKNYFIIIGDIKQKSTLEFLREGNKRGRKLVLAEIVKRGPAFVVNLGDLVSRGSSDKRWRRFDELHKEFRERRIPYFPILGNHELYGNDNKALGNFFMRFPYLNQQRWYSFTWEGTAFIMLDSNFSTLTAEQNTQQLRWYIEELERFERDEQVRHVIVVSHQPPFTNNWSGGPSRSVQKYFAEPFLRFRKTALFLSGHVHTYERFEKGGKHFVVSGGGGAPRSSVITDLALQRYEDLFSGPERRALHFCQIERRDKALLFSMLRLEPDGSFSLADALTIQ